MLIDFDSTKLLYVFGKGVPALELSDWISNELPVEIKHVDQNELNNLPANSQCIMGFSNREFRFKLFMDSAYKAHNWVSYIHPSSIVSATARIGKGVVIQPMADIGYNVVIGDFSWVTPYCLVSHGATLGNNVVLSPRTIIGGSTSIGNDVTIGMGSTICDKILIGNNIEFVMSSVVTKDITEPGRYYSNKKMITL
jgi:UDP-3-O-[3-hydroxymyristoyl] glucosamine N-acyltransferase